MCSLLVYFRVFPCLSLANVIAKFRLNDRAIFSHANNENHDIRNLCPKIKPQFKPPVSFYRSLFRFNLIKVLRTLINLNPPRINFSLSAAFLFIFALCLVPGIGRAAEVVLAWDANQEPDLAGYMIYYGEVSRNYTHMIDAGNITQYNITDLQDGTTYYFALTAYNGDGYESDYSYELPYTVAIINHIPATPSAPEGPSSGYPQTGYSFRTTASDPDSDILEYRFDWGDGSISVWGSSSETHAWASTGNFCIKSQARDDQDARSDWSTCSNISISEFVHTISATADANGSITPSGNVSVTQGSNKTFAIASNLNYQVRDVLVDGVSVGAVTSYTFSNVSQNHTIQAVFELKNQPPIADAGPDQTVNQGVVVRLDGSGSSDTDDGVASYTWTQTSGPPVTLSDPQSSETIFVSPNVGSKTESLTFLLMVKDHQGLQTEDSCIIIVNSTLESDSDKDGISDIDEINLYGTDPEKFDSDGDGLSDGEELAFWGEDWNADADGDGLINILDPEPDSDLNPGESSPQKNPTVEVGGIIVDHNWVRINFQKSFEDPVVIVQSFSLNDAEPGVIRLRNIDSYGFEIRVQEWNYLDGIHGKENTSYIVIERGSYALDDGTRIEAGSFESDKIGAFGAVTFDSSFTKIPVVMATISSFNESDAATGRMRNTDIEGFEFCMQEQESTVKSHQFETINYLAWEPSTGKIDGLTFEVDKSGDTITNNLQGISFNQTFTSEPQFFADIQTSGGMDTANVRWQKKNTETVEVKIDEEQSKDVETSHTTEVLGYIVIAGQNIENEADLDSDGLSDIDEQFIYKTDPNISDTDGDGLEDGQELDYWGNNWNLDYDSDGIMNIVDPDSDGDGYNDGIEVNGGYDPSDPSSHEVSEQSDSTPFYWDRWWWWLKNR